ncbi:MAG: phage portal protein [Rhodospirillales bacterium]|nr:phage portal protein [Rhodospirillales bacterium]
MDFGFVGGLLAGAGTQAGVRVDATAAMKCATVLACVRVVSEDVAKLPLRILRVRADGALTPARDHPLWPVLSLRPNRWQSVFEWRETIQVHLELYGNAYCAIERDGRGAVTSLRPVFPNRVQVLRAEDGELFYRIDGGTIVPAEAVLHIRGMSGDGVVGTSTVSWLAETIGLTLAAEQFGSSFFGNSARPDVIIAAKNPVTAEQIAEARSRWEELYRGPRRAFRPAVMPFDLEVKTLSLTNKDSQLLELRQFQVADIARGFRIPPHKIGDLSKATFSNIEHQALEYFVDGLMPRLERIESALERDLLTDAEAGRYVIEFDFTRILRADLKTTLDAIAVGRQWGVLSANDGRRWLGLNPIANGDVYLEPLNMVPAGTPRQTAAPTESAPETPPQPQAGGEAAGG